MVTSPSEASASLDQALSRKADMEEVLTAARLNLGVREDLEGHKDADLAIVMLMASLKDPFTSYIDKETIKKLNSALNGRFSGVTSSSRPIGNRRHPLLRRRTGRHPFPADPPRFPHLRAHP